MKHKPENLGYHAVVTVCGWNASMSCSHREGEAHALTHKFKQQVPWDLEGEVINVLASRTYPLIYRGSRDRKIHAWPGRLFGHSLH